MRLPSSSIFVLLLLAACVLVFVTIAYYLVRQKHAKEAEDSIFLTSKQDLGFDRWYNLYTTFANIGFTSHYLENLRLQFEILNPDNEKEVKTKAIKTALIVWGLSLSIFVVMFLFNPRLFTLLCAFWLIYTLSTGFVKSSSSPPPPLPRVSPSPTTAPASRWCCSSISLSMTACPSKGSFLTKEVKPC